MIKHSLLHKYLKDEFKRFEKDKIAEITICHHRFVGKMIVVSGLKHF